VTESTTGKLCAKAALRALIWLKTRTECSFTTDKRRFFAGFCLVVGHNSTFAFNPDPENFEQNDQEIFSFRFYKWNQVVGGR